MGTGMGIGLMEAAWASSERGFACPGICILLRCS